MSQSQNNNNRPSRNNGASGHLPNNMTRAAYDGYGPGYNASYFVPNPNMGYYSNQNFGNMYGYNPYGGYAGYEPNGMSPSVVVPPSVVSSMNETKKVEKVETVKDDKKTEVEVEAPQQTSVPEETPKQSIPSAADVAAIEAAAAAAAATAAAAAASVSTQQVPAAPSAAAASTPAASQQSSGNSKLNSFLGRTMDLTSKVKIRYVGTLCNIDTVNATVALQNVRSFGTENRVKPGEGTIYPASNDVYEYLVFNSRDIESLFMREDPVPAPAAAEAPVDPAIVSSGKRVNETSASAPASKPEEGSEYDFEAANKKFAALSLAGKDSIQVDKAYDKEKSFFDDLSIERNDRGVRGVNLETFGSAALPNGRRGGRGGNRGGNRGGSRGNYYNADNEYSGGGGNRRSQYNNNNSSSGNTWRQRDEFGNDARRNNTRDGNRGGRGGKAPQKPRTPFFTNKFDD